jgi:vacuolar-type H+-ATPase subunit E/Vma4
MSIIQEKLELFEKLMLGDAARSRNAILDQLRGESSATLENIISETGREASLEYQKEMQRIAAEKDSSLSKANIDSRKLLMKARGEILESVLAELSRRLVAFTRSESYGAYMAANIRVALARAGLFPPEATSCVKEGAAVDAANSVNEGVAVDATGKIRVYFTPRDFGAFSAEAQRYSSGIAVMRGGEEAIGGVRVENKAEGIYIDNTLQTKVRQCSDELYQISGLTIGGRDEFQG